MFMKKKKIIYLFLSALFMASLAGFSYAYFLANPSDKELTSTILSTSSQLELTYTDGAGSIAGVNIAPGWSASKTFTVANTGKGTASYKFYISNITSTFMTDSLTVTITDTSDNSTPVNNVSVPTTSSTISNSVTIAMGVTKTYNLTVTYQNLTTDQISDMGKNFS